MIAVWVALAGAAGAAARFAVDGLVRHRWSGPAFPWATLVINVSGSLLLGVVTGLVLYRGGPDDLRLIVGTGFCGGYTTFSTASFETVRLAQRNSMALALGYGAATIVLTLGAGVLGLFAVH